MAQNLIHHPRLHPPSSDHPEIDNPNEPGWNGRLLSFGVGAVIFTATIIMWWALTNSPT